MRVLIVDTELAALDFALRCVEDGHEVQLFLQTPHPIGVGFEGVERIGDLAAGLRWAGKDGLILPTGNAKFLRELDRWRDFGFPVFGPSYASAQLEIDREAGMKMLQDAGVEVPHYETFGSLQDAARFARKADQAYVFKTLGSEDDKSLSYVASDPADLVAWIDRQCARGLTLKGPCMLQQKIEMLCEMGVSAWMGSAGFLEDKWQVCFEHKKLMNGELGPNTGEMGSVTIYLEKEKLAEELLKPVELAILKTGHRGDTAVNCAIDKQGKAWFLEWTMRLGWPAFYLQTASHKGDVAQWMRDALDGKDTLKVDRRPHVGVVMAQPPWPQFNGKPDCVEGNPICGLDEVWDQVHPCMMMLGKGPVMDAGRVEDGPVYQTAGELVCVVTGAAGGIQGARERCYAAADDIKFSDRLYRTDIGQKLQEPLPALHDAGYALELEW